MPEIELAYHRHLKNLKESSSNKDAAKVEEGAEVDGGGAAAPESTKKQ